MTYTDVHRGVQLAEELGDAIVRDLRNNGAPAATETLASGHATTVKVVFDAREVAVVTLAVRPSGLHLTGTLVRDGVAPVDLGQYDVGFTGWPDDKVRRLMQSVRLAADRYVVRMRSGDS